MILVYHKVGLERRTVWWVTADAFNRQMAALRAYEVVHLDDYDPSNPRHVVITFDGVYEDVLRCAVPLLRKWRYPFELFVVGDTIGRGNDFDRAVEPPARFASLEGLRRMVEAGGRLQWHTRTHPQMDGLAGEELAREVEVPEALARSFGPPHFRWFAYPFGRRSERVHESLRRRFVGALACDGGDPADRYDLPRRIVTEETRLDRSTVSVIVANYNYGRFLGEAVDSVLRQRVPADEVIVIDDASTDNSRAVMEQFADQTTLVFNDTNLGIVGNFRKAVGLSSGDYVALLGADNRMRSDYVERCKAALDARPDAAIAYTDMLVFGARGGLLADRVGATRVAESVVEGCGVYRWEFPEPTPETLAELDRRNFIHGSSMYRRRDYDAVGGYRQGEGPEDHDLFRRMLRSGREAVHVAAPLIEYRQHSPGQANTVILMEQEIVGLLRQTRRQAQVIGDLQQELRSVYASTSWRVTRPLRGAGRLGRGAVALASRIFRRGPGTA